MLRRKLKIALPLVRAGLFFCENEHVRIFSYTMIFVASRIGHWTLDIGHWTLGIAHSQIEFLIEFLIESLIESFIDPGGIALQCPLLNGQCRC